ncbi:MULTISPECIES: MOSC N-terminal beta barrel domain-containing protein [unclassified Methylophaga]|jgi:hypothetical protein|uniref:MOSC domain-containing protein n=1 Tax=unclassified Methylophaga TaxID=2629249 RepID=UPI00259C7F36|nr:MULTISPECIES: MOSC N-terminal beta barrel domain-containing protein [unclassified Methylophaga]|tara:strand:- start:528 stop:1391 length:864 start_codon:yes stop_codon:yes gene_type:complete
MLKVGTIKQIWRYPVKGMAGEQLEQCYLGENGLTGDRIWALQDTQRQEIQSCKFRPELLRCNAKCRRGDATGPDDQVDITFPDGAVIGSDEPQVNQLLTLLTGFDSTLQPLKPIEEQDFYKRYKQDDHTWLEELKATFDREPGEALPDLDNLPEQAQEYVSLPGTFFLVTPFHMLTTATLDYMKQLKPDSDWAVERFRPNIVIETVPGMEGLIEQAWLDKTIQIGQTTVQCCGTTPRCGAITRQQRHIPSDKKMLRTIVKQADQNLGVYGAIAEAGVIRVGDEVFIQ